MMSRITRQIGKICQRASPLRVGAPVRQEVYHTVLLEVADDRAVAPAAQPCPVIDPNDPRRREHDGTRPDHAQQRVAADRHGEPPGQARPGSATQCKADMPLHVAQARGAACPGRPQLGQALGEDLPRATGGCAPEPPCPYLDSDDAPLPGQVSQRAGVAAVDLPGKAAAKRAGTLGQRGHGDNGDAVRRGQNLHDRQTCRDQRQQKTGQRGVSSLRKPPSHVVPGRPRFHPTAPKARMNPCSALVHTWL